MSSPRRTSPPTTPSKPLPPAISHTNPTTRTLNPSLRSRLTTPVTPTNDARNTTTASARRLINPTTTPPNSLHASRLIHLSAITTPQHSPRHCIGCGKHTEDLQCFNCRLEGVVPGTPTRRDVKTGMLGMARRDVLEEARRQFERSGMGGERRRGAVERLAELGIEDVGDEGEEVKAGKGGGGDREMN